MLTSRAVRLGSRRIAAGSSRAFASAAQVSAKNDFRQLAPLLAAAGLAVAGTALYREVRGYESKYCEKLRQFLLTYSDPFLDRIQHTTLLEELNE